MALFKKKENKEKTQEKKEKSVITEKVIRFAKAAGFTIVGMALVALAGACAISAVSDQENDSSDDESLEDNVLTDIDFADEE